MEPHFRIREQQEEYQRNVADLREWEKSQKAKDTRASRRAGAGQPEPTRELAPIRYTDWVPVASQRVRASVQQVIRKECNARGSSYDNGATVIEEIVPEPVASSSPQGAKPDRQDRGKENHAAMHTYDHSNKKWENFNPDEEEKAPSGRHAKPSSPAKTGDTLADGFLRARESTRKPQQKPLPPVRQPPQAYNSAEGHKNRGNELFRKTQYDQAVEAYTRQVTAFATLEHFCPHLHR